MEGLADRSVYLTGGTGFLGGHLRRRLAEAGCPVTVLVSPDSEADPRETETVVRGDVTDPDTIDVADHDIVVHLAGLTSVDAAISDPTPTWRVNANGTQTVLEAARQADTERVLYASTASVYGIPESLPIDERHRLDPVEPYGASKLAGDRLAVSYARTYGLPVVVPRLFNTYGPGQPRHNVIGSIVAQALDGDTVELGNTSPSRDFTYISDVIEALVLLVTDGTTGETYNVGSGTETTIGELAERITDLVDHEVAVVSTSDRKRLADIPRHVADAGKLRELGWEPTTDLETGLAATIDWFADTA